MIHLLFAFCISTLTLQCSQMEDELQKLNKMLLFECSKGSEPSFLQTLLDEGADINFASKERQGATPLHAAAQHGHKKVVKFLIQNGANINAACYDGRTALHFAMLKKHKELIELLLEQKSLSVNAPFEIHRKDHKIFGLTALHLAFLCDEDIEKKLLERGANKNQVPTTTGKDNIIIPVPLHTVQALLMTYFQIEATSKGATPLHMAAVHKLHLLVGPICNKKFVDINATWLGDKTALHVALLCEHKEVTACFLEQEAINVNAPCGVNNILGLTPLHIVARYNGAVEIAKKLIEKGAKINATCADGRTALHFALQQKHTEVVKLLLEQELIDVNALFTSNYKELEVHRVTPLHLALTNKLSKEIIAKLIEKGANKYASDSRGTTPLDIMRAKCPELISLLSASPSTPRKLSHEKLA